MDTTIRPLTHIGGHALPPELVLLTPDEVAEILLISPSSVRLLIHRGDIPAYFPLPTKPRVPLVAWSTSSRTRRSPLGDGGGHPRTAGRVAGRPTSTGPPNPPRWLFVACGVLAARCRAPH